MSDVSLSIDQIEYPMTIVDGTSLTLVLSGPQGPAGGESGGGSWGSITGDLVDQEDLTLALAAKVPTTRTVAGHSLSSNVTLVSADISDASQTWLAGSLPVYGWGGITVATDYTSLDGYYAPQAIQNGKPSFGDGEFTDVGAWRSLGYSGGVWTIISYLDGTQLGYFTGEGEWPSEVVTWSPESGAIGSVVTSVTAVDRRLAGFTLPAGAGTLALTSDLSGYVPTSRTIAGHALTGDITLFSADISDAATSGTPGALVKYDANGNVTAEDVNGGGANFYVFVGTDITTAFTYRISAAGLITVDRNYSPPNADGTLALTASATGVPDKLHNATISGTVTFSGTGQASMFAALGTGTPSSTTYLRGDGTWATVAAGGVTGTGAVDNAILRADGVGGTTLQNSDITISDATVTTQANVAIVNAHSGQTNSTLVLTPLGTGAFIVGPRPDGTATGGNARGANAFDLQTSRTAAAVVASGSNSVAIGTNNTASGSNSVAIGANSTAGGSNSVSLGVSNFSLATNSFVAGEGNTSSGRAATALGQNTVSSASAALSTGLQANSYRNNMIAQGGGYFSTMSRGEGQGISLVLGQKTTDAAFTVLRMPGSASTEGSGIFQSSQAGYMGIRSGTITSGIINITGTKSDGSATAHYMRQFSIRNIVRTVLSIDALANTITFTTNHNLVDDDPIRITSTSTMIPPLTEGAIYYAKVIDPTTISVHSATPVGAGNIMDISGIGAGTKYMSSTKLVYAPVVTIGSDFASGTSIAITAVNVASTVDPVNNVLTADYLSIAVAGIATETWRWVAHVGAVEIIYGT